MRLVGTALSLASALSIHWARLVAGPQIAFPV